jgi:Ca2+-dependent lipid-binding protein
MKTKVIDNNLNPVWNQSFMLSWDGQAPLGLQVVDKDFFKSDGRSLQNIFLLAIN